MERNAFLKILQGPEGDELLATVLEGPQQGEQLLLHDGAPVWPEHPEGFWAQELPELKNIPASGVQMLGQRRVFVERFGAAPHLIVCGGGHV